MNCSLSARLFLCVEAQLDAAALGYKVPSSARLTDVTTGTVSHLSLPEQLLQRFICVYF